MLNEVELSKLYSIFLHVVVPTLEEQRTAVGPKKMIPILLSSLTKQTLASVYEQRSV